MKNARQTKITLAIIAAAAIQLMSVEKGPPESIAASRSFGKSPSGPISLTQPLRDLLGRLESTPMDEELLLRSFLAPGHSTAAGCDALVHGQFDFWVGEWDVQPSPGQPGAGQTIATSIIQRLVQGCVVLENYNQGDVYNGKSLNYVDPASGKWRQIWVDSRGTVSQFAGEYREGGIHYDGETQSISGTKLLRKMILSPLGADRVRQYSERSDDNGKRWTVAYDFNYIRRQ